MVVTLEQTDSRSFSLRKTLKTIETLNDDSHDDVNFVIRGETRGTASDAEYDNSQF